MQNAEVISQEYPRWQRAGNDPNVWYTHLDDRLFQVAIEWPTIPDSLYTCRLYEWRKDRYTWQWRPVVQSDHFRLGNARDRAAEIRADLESVLMELAL